MPFQILLLFNGLALATTTTTTTTSAVSKPRPIPHTTEIADSGKTTSAYDLPPFSKRSECVFLWEDIDGETFSHTIQCCYDELVHWKKDLFKIPSGRSGKEFIVEMTRLLNAYTNSSTQESIVFKAIMSMPALNHILNPGTKRTQIISCVTYNSGTKEILMLCSRKADRSKNSIQTN